LRCDLPEREAWIATRVRADHYVLYAERASTGAAAPAEPAAALDRVVVLSFSQAAKNAAANRRREPVLVSGRCAPAGRQLDAAAVDVDAIGLGPERDLIASAEDRRAVQVVAIAVAVGADAEFARQADVVLVAFADRRVDQDTGQDRPAPRVARMPAERGRRLRRARCAGPIADDAGAGAVVLRGVLVHDTAEAELAPGLGDFEG